MKNLVQKSLLSIAILLVSTALSLTAADEFPPDWLPVEQLDRETDWDDDESSFIDKVHLYLPSDKPVRGVFVCFVFHSADPREAADAWNFALVTITRDTIKDLGIRDRKTGKRTLGYKDQGLVEDPQYGFGTESGKQLLFDASYIEKL